MQSSTMKLGTVILAFLCMSTHVRPATAQQAQTETGSMAEWLGIVPKSVSSSVGMAWLIGQAIDKASKAEKDQWIKKMVQRVFEYTKADGTEVVACTEITEGACLVVVALSCTVLEGLVAFWSGQHNSNVLFDQYEGKVKEMDELYHQMLLGALQLPAELNSKTYGDLKYAVSFLANTQQQLAADANQAIQDARATQKERWNIACSLDFFGFVCSPAIPSSVVDDMTQLETSLTKFRAGLQGLVVCVHDGCSSNMIDFGKQKVQTALHDICVEMQQIASSEDDAGCSTPISQWAASMPANPVHLQMEPVQFLEMPMGSKKTELQDALTAMKSQAQDLHNEQVFTQWAIAIEVALLFCAAVWWKSVAEGLVRLAASSTAAASPPQASLASCLWQCRCRPRVQSAADGILANALLPPEAPDIEDQEVVQFEPGDVGIGLTKNVVTSVSSEGQAAKVGVRIGWIVKKIGDAKFSLESLKAAEHGTSSYQIVFDKNTVSDTQVAMCRLIIATIIVVALSIIVTCSVLHVMVAGRWEIALDTMQTEVESQAHTSLISLKVGLDSNRQVFEEMFEHGLSEALDAMSAQGADLRFF